MVISHRTPSAIPGQSRGLSMRSGVRTPICERAVRYVRPYQPHARIVGQSPVGASFARPLLRPLRSDFAVHKSAASGRGPARKGQGCPVFYTGENAPLRCLGSHLARSSRFWAWAGTSFSCRVGTRSAGVPLPRSVELGAAAKHSAPPPFPIQIAGLEVGVGCCAQHLSTGNSDLMGG